MPKFFSSEKPNLTDDAFRNLNRLEGAENTVGVPTYDSAIKKMRGAQPREEVPQREVRETTSAAEAIDELRFRRLQEDLGASREQMINLWHAKQNPPSMREIIFGWLRNLTRRSE